MVKRMLDLAQLKNKENKMAELKYFNALMATVAGNDEQRENAKKFLAEMDPDIWEESQE